MRGYVSFEEAREYVRALHFKSAAEFRKWCGGKLPEREPKPFYIPSNPHQVYKPEFQGYADFIGSGHVATYRREWADFLTAREYVWGLELDTLKEWKDYCKGRIPDLPPRPDWLPTNPAIVYSAMGWAGSRDWLGTRKPGEKRRLVGSKMRPFGEARTFARTLGLPSWLEWRKYVGKNIPHLPPKPSDIPALPHIRYKDEGWISYADFLGGEKVAWHSSKWRSFTDARQYVRSLGLHTQKDWRKWYGSSGPPDIPYSPDRVYEEWVGWKDWFRDPDLYSSGVR